jgi:hypothetical protein
LSGEAERDETNGSPEAAPKASTASSEPWTVGEAQAEMSALAGRLRAELDLLRRIHRGLRRPPDMAAREEGRKALDVTTDILAAIECLEADAFLPAIERIEYLAHATDEKLAEEHRAWLRRERTVRRSSTSRLATRKGRPKL